MAARPRITLIVVGTLRETFWREASAEYVKRLGGLTSRFEIIELSEDDPAREGARILEKLPTRALILACDGRGKLISSEALSEKIERSCIDGEGHLVFLIGGSDGLSDAVRERADLLLSFGPMTFPHQLLRVMLLEQLYRALQISRGSAYHK
jgi:23S rRNA (pseudouridine1915-N3)-methyltransferase